jgi:hypothetical protein
MKSYFSKIYLNLIQMKLYLGIGIVLIEVMMRSDISHHFLVECSRKHFWFPLKLITPFACNSIFIRTYPLLKTMI